MNNYEKLRQLCHQNYIGSEKCGECEGIGGYQLIEGFNYEKEADNWEMCESCKGKGYTIQLEKGCEVEEDKNINLIIKNI